MRHLFDDGLSLLQRKVAVQILSSSTARRSVTAW